MTHCENEVYTKLKAAILAKYPGADVQAEYVHSPSVLPHVSIELSDTQVMRIAMDTSDTSKMDVVMFTVTIYSNLGSGKREQARGILDVVDEEMYQMNFRRLSAIPLPNMADATIYRLTARYRAATDGQYFYRR